MIPFLPGSRRHDPDTDLHLRARDLLAARLDGPITDQDEAWLEDHLLDCDMCVTAGIDYREQASLLREMPWPEAPRDLGARTRAAIELEAGGRSGGHSPRRSLIPLGALSGALVVAVVVGASLLSQPVVTPLTESQPPVASSPTPRPSILVARATPIPVGAGDVGWVLRRDDGTYALSYAPVDKVCTKDTKSDCPRLAPPTPETLTLAAAPRAILSSPGGSELVVVDAGTRTTGGDVMAVNVPSSSPSRAPSPSPTAEPSPTVAVSASPAGTSGPVAIASDVVVVGETAAYSPDGAWFAFSARPSDGTDGPDVYVWQPGTEAAHPVTTDHDTVFSGWYGDRILASRVPDPSASLDVAPALLAGAPALVLAGSVTTAATSPDPSPSVAPDVSPEPNPSEGPTTSPGPSAEPTVSPEASPAAPSVRGTTLLIDPATGRTLGAPMDAWRPVVDPTGRIAVYWDGTLVQDDDGLGWHPGDGSLVVAAWPGAAADAPDPSASPDASADPSASPDASPSPEPADPLSGIHATLAERPTEWDVRWDESGTRFALWVADRFDPSVGQLSLHVVDRATGAIDPKGPLLQATPALAGFSIGRDRLAWATPSGQDGQGSTIQVLAWQGDAAGQIESDPEPGSTPVIVIR